MSNLQLQKEKLLKALIEDEGTKAILKKLIDAELSEDPYIKACAILRKTPKPELEDKSDADEVWQDNAGRLATCIKAKNIIDGKIWVPVYDGSETHYWPVPDLSDPSGFGFSVTDFDDWRASSGVGSRLEYRSTELAEEGFEEFKPYYKIHFTK
jgi:hypothetical protein